jgi:hypothetical protein
MREEELGDRLGMILRDIQIPDAVLAPLQELLLADKAVRKRPGHNKVGPWNSDWLNYIAGWIRPTRIS